LASLRAAAVDLLPNRELWLAGYYYGVSANQRKREHA